MPRLTFSTIYSTVEGIAKTASTKRDFVKRGIQMGLDRATSGTNLPYLMTPGVILTVAPYETGTVTTTDGSTTITGSGTTFTAAMVGRKIRIGSEEAYYRIASFTSTTVIALDVAYTGTGASGASYSIYKDEYRLPADLNVYKVFRQLEEGIAMGSVEPTAFDLRNPAPSSEGTPNFEIFRGSKLDTYTTGTVSTTTGSATITGSSTSWATVDGLGIGNRITIGTQVLTIKSVDSDTQITTYETASSDNTDTTYSISMDNPIIQFEQIPDDEIPIRYFYQRVAYPLVNDTDVPDLPEEWQHILITAGLIWAWWTKDKEEAKATEAIFALQTKEMWNRIGHISRARNYSRRSQDRDTLFEKYGPRYPNNVGPTEPLV